VSVLEPSIPQSFQFGFEECSCRTPNTFLDDITSKNHSRFCLAEQTLARLPFALAFIRIAIYLNS
jgi:hypothetical protein